MGFKGESEILYLYPKVPTYTFTTIQKTQAKNI
jgi:hypothetical protein